MGIKCKTNNYRAKNYIRNLYRLLIFSLLAFNFHFFHSHRLSMVCKVMQKSSETVPIINHSEINITLEQCENIKKQFVRIPKTTLIDMKDTSTKRQASLTS